MVTMFQMLVVTEELGTMDSLKVMGLGLLVVFSVLAMLIVLIEVLHATLKDKKTAPVENVQHAPKPEKRISAGVMAEAPESAKAGEDPEFIAAVSAAITCVTGNANFKIKSIKKG